MKQNKIISGILMVAGAVLMLTSSIGWVGTSWVTGFLVLSAGSIGLLLSNKDKG